MGRHRPLPDIKSNVWKKRGHAERAAINTPIQVTLSLPCPALPCPVLPCPAPHRPFTQTVFGYLAFRHEGSGRWWVAWGTGDGWPGAQVVGGLGHRWWAAWGTGDGWPGAQVMGGLGHSAGGLGRETASWAACDYSWY